MKKEIRKDDKMLYKDRQNHPGLQAIVDEFKQKHRLQ